MNEFTTQPWSFEEDVARYRDLGVDAIEICEAKLDPARIEEQMCLVRESGLSVSAVQPLVRTFFGSAMVPEPEATEARVKRLTQSLKTLAPHVPGSVFVTNTGAPPKGNMRRTMDETVRYLKELCPLPRIWVFPVAGAAQPDLGEHRKRHLDHRAGHGHH